MGGQGEGSGLPSPLPQDFHVVHQPNPNRPSGSLWRFHAMEVQGLNPGALVTNSTSSPSPPPEGRREGTGSSNTNPKERCLYWQPVPLLSCPRGFPKVTSLTEQKMPLWLSSLKIPRLSEALRQQQEEDPIHTSYWEPQYHRPHRMEAAVGAPWNSKPEPGNFYLGLGHQSGLRPTPLFLLLSGRRPRAHHRMVSSMAPPGKTQDSCNHHGQA